MKRFLEKISLLQALIGMIIFSLLAPLPILFATYVHSSYTSKQQSIYETNTKKFNLSSEIFSESLWNYYPELGQKLLTQLTLEPNIVFIRVIDAEQKPFLMWKSPKETPKDALVSFEKILEKEGRIIGFCEMRFRKMGVLESVISDMTLFGSILLLQALFIIMVISFVYVHKVVRPIRRLVDDATLLAEHKLDKPFAWNEHDEIGVLGVALDKTRMKLKELFEKLKGENERLDEKVRQRTLELESASRYKSEFLANMSHEIRTPMNAITGMLHLLSKTALNATQINYLHKTKDASSILLHIINDILDFSKIEAGKVEVECIVFDLHKELKKSCSIFSVLAKEKGLGFESNFVHTNRFFKGDSHKIMQIVNNFLSNAIKFTTQGTIFLNLQETQEKENVRLVFSVRDTGMGISKEKQSLLFQAFGQLDASITRKHGGTGLGLYICTQLATMMQGVIRVQSDEGRGSTFSFEITLPTAQAFELQKEESSVAYQPLHILLISDDALLSSSLREFIRSFGFFITCKKEIAEVLEECVVLETEPMPYQLLLIDQALPHTSGLEVYEALKAKCSYERLPTAILISNDDTDVKQRALESGFRSVLSKPINPSMLYDDITAFCDVMRQQPLFDPSRIDLSEKRILIVEDNEINLEVALYLLKDTQAKIELARNGLEAVAFAQNKPFDLILMDVQMPLMDGYEATRIIRNELKLPTPIVAMTANVMAHDIEKCLAAGMNFHIGKPFEIEDFYGTLLEALHLGLNEAKPKVAHKQEKNLSRFDKNEALKKLGGLESLWDKTFQSFYEQYLNAPRVIENLIQEKNLTTLVDYVHTLKGLCGTVGAFALRHEAAKIEAHLKEKKEITTLERNAFTREHQALFEMLLPLYETNNALDASDKVVTTALQEEILKGLDALERALETSHVTRISALLDDVSSYKVLRENQTFAALALACRTFDFDSALVHVDALKKELTNG